MGALYEVGLVDRIAQGVRTEDVDGLAVEVRPVPDDARPHALDPRINRRWDLFMESVLCTGDLEHQEAVAAELECVSAPLDGVEVDERVDALALDGREVEVRVVRPKGAEGPLPVVFYFHGGGFAYGQWSMFKDTLPALACRAGCVVVFPEYRLAPANPFPAGLDDCRETVLWALAHAEELGIDAGRVAFAGDSAGGSLANGVAIQLADAGVVKLIVEFYPLTDAGPVPEGWSFDLFPHLPEQDEAVCKRIDKMRGMVDYLPGLYTQGSWEEIQGELVSALNCARPEAFPRTVVVTCEFDYLRHQEEAFARKLADAGADVRCIRYEGCAHAFFENCGLYPQVEDAIRVMAEEISRL